METSHNQYEDLKARYEKASSETKTKHEEILQNLRKMLLDTGERLKAVQEENRGLTQEVEELRIQADKAKVCAWQSPVAVLRLAQVQHQGFRVLRKQQQMGCVV